MAARYLKFRVTRGRKCGALYSEMPRNQQSFSQTFLFGHSQLTQDKDLPGRMLRLYKRWISPFLGPRCRFFPSCSVYCAGCIRRHGWLAGTWLGVNRLLRCQPLCNAGFDPVPERFLWLGSRVQPLDSANKTDST
jgi:uncharacterized protein